MQAFIVRNEGYKYNSSIFNHRSTTKEITSFSGLNFPEAISWKMTWGQESTIKRYGCTLKDCYSAFRTQEELDQHKKSHDVEFRCM